MKNNKVSTTKHEEEKINKLSTSSFNEMDATEIVLTMELRVIILFKLDKTLVASHLSL